MPERLLSAAACAEIAERAAKATAGPWVVSPAYDGMSTVAIMRSPDRAVHINADEAHSLTYERTRENGHFIAAAREDIPALLATVAALREALMPFAHFSAMLAERPLGQIGKPGSEPLDIYAIHTGTQWAASLTVGDLKRAAAVYDETA